MNDFSTVLDHIGATYLAGESTDIETLNRLQSQFADLATQLDADDLCDASLQSRGVAEEIETCLREARKKTQCRTLWGHIEKSLETLQTLLAMAEAPAPDVAANNTTPAANDIFTDATSEEDAGDLDPDLLAGFISEAQEHLEAAESNLLLLEDNPHLQGSLAAVFRAFHTIKGVAGFLSLTHVVELAHEAENLLDMARNGALELTGRACDLTLASVDCHKQQVRCLIAAPVRGESDADRQRRVRLIEDIRALASGKHSDVAGGDAKPAEVEVERTPVIDAPSAAKAETSSAGVKDAVKVDRERLDKLIDMIGELVIAESMVHQEVMTGGTIAAQCRPNLTQLNKITRNLQQLSLSLRMVPVRGTFQKMARLVRDLSKKIKKPVDFITAGEETELDKTIVDQIGDPMVHLLRNSIDHGLEDSPETRVANGKSPRGQVTLRAFHQTGNILIEIEDDGRGLNRSAILAKAKQRGLVRDDQVLSDEEVYNLIFQAGFSTAEKITDVSGRGVGMDVVKRNVEKLGGNVTLRSNPGRGTTVSMRLPLTLAIIDGMVVRVSEQRYVLPTLSIVELIGLDVVKVNRLYDRDETIVVRDQILPLHRISDLLQLRRPAEATGTSLVVVVEDQGKLAGLLVDEVLGQQQVVIKSLDGLDSQRGIAGGAVMPDGAVGIILDVHDLLEMAREVPDSV